MAISDNIHSRVVFWLKIVLPLMALVILSTLFLFSRRIDIEASLPYSEVDVKELAREQRLTRPEYSTVTSDGSALRISAAIAYPQTGSNSSATADSLVARYDTKGGLRLDLEATTGRVDEAAGNMTLRDGVRINTSTGYEMTTSGLDAALDRTRLISEGAVTATGPLGRLDAGQMEIRQTDAEIGDYVLIFKQGVKLVYDPANRGPK
jgi:lipopolysaccharide export system protein LptC